MRIGMLAHAGSIHTVRWANALAERGVEVHLFSSHGFSDAVSDAVYRRGLPFRPNLGYFSNALILRRLLSKTRPDLLHSHYSSGYGTLGRLSGYRPHVVSVWGSDVYHFPEQSRWKKKLVMENLRAADQVCSTSLAMARHTQSLCTTERPIAVTPFGIDLKRFLNRLEERGDASIVVGTVKTLRPKYGIDTLIEGFAQCRRRLGLQVPELATRLRLRIVGEGPQENELRELARAEGVAGVTDFVGKVPHERVPEELNKLDVYVAVSRFDSESFGVAVIEASACEKPVIVSDTPGLQEVVEHGRTGVVIPREEPGILAENLYDLVTDADRRREYGIAGRQRVKELYDWNKNVDDMQRIYESVMHRAKAA